VSRGYQLTLPYPVHSGNRAVRHARGLHYVSDKTLEYRTRVADIAGRLGLRARKLAGPLRVEFLLAPPDSRARDADNVLKVVKDALTKAGVWADDSNKVITELGVKWAPYLAEGGVVVVDITDHSVRG
jgi:crossover junction endodeoxyribonuclease RusA